MIRPGVEPVVPPRLVSVIGWVAIGISVVALVVAGLSARYARRQAIAAEEGNWWDPPADFTATIVNPHSGSARLSLSYNAGPPLDDVRVEVLLGDASPALGFGIGAVGSSSWEIGAMRVGARADTGVVQALSGSGGPTWRSGHAPLRVHCSSGRHTREVHITADFPEQPFAY